MLLSLFYPVIHIAYEVGAEIAGCDDNNSNNSLFNEMSSLISEIISETPSNILERSSKMEEYNRQREEGMANRIFESLNKIDENERKETIRNYRVPVIAIIGEGHANNVAQKLREKGVKVEVINLKPIKDEKVLIRR